MQAESFVVAQLDAGVIYAITVMLLLLKLRTSALVIVHSFTSSFTYTAQLLGDVTLIPETLEVFMGFIIGMVNNALAFAHPSLPLY